MSVYVDELRNVAAFGGPRCFTAGACHLTADTIDELHAMADRLGLRRSWFQSASTPHYDLTAHRRRAALASGAVFVSAREQARARLRARGALQHG